MVVLMWRERDWWTASAAFAESRSASSSGRSVWGKAKMVSQSAAVIAILMCSAKFPGRDGDELVTAAWSGWALYRRSSRRAHVKSRWRHPRRAAGGEREARRERGRARQDARRGRRERPSVSATVSDRQEKASESATTAGEALRPRGKLPEGRGAEGEAEAEGAPPRASPRPRPKPMAEKPFGPVRRNSARRRRVPRPRVPAGGGKKKNGQESQGSGPRRSS